MDVTKNSVHKQFFFLLFDDVTHMHNKNDSNNYLDEIVHSCHDLIPVLHSMKFCIFLIRLFLYLDFDVCLSKTQFDMNSD